MAYIKTTWKDRLVQRPRTYFETTNADGSITHVPSEGAITEAGTPVNASNLNKLENGLEAVSAVADTLRTDVDGHTTELTAVNAQLAETANLLADNPVKPEDFTGTDYQKVQAAFDQACTEGRGLMISKSYNIGSNTITITKGTEVREPTKVFGGGKITKDTSGYMFVGSAVSTSDIFFDGIWFEGADGIDVTPFDCGDGFLIRMAFTNCYFKKINNVFYTSTYLQDIKLYSSTLVNCSGALFDYQGSFGLVVDGLTIENCTGQVIRHVGNTPPNNSSINVNISRCIIEGFTTTKTLFEIARGGITLDGNYFEAIPAGVLKFAGTASGVDVKNNILLGVTNGVPFITWGSTIEGAANVKNNVSVLSPMNDATLLTSGRIIVEKTTSNFVDIDPNHRIYDAAVDVINNTLRKVGNNFFTLLVSKSIPNSTKVDLCTISPYLNGGLYVVVRGGGLQGNIGVFGINKSFKVSRSGSTLAVTLGADESWGDSASQKDNIFLEVSGTNVVLRANGRNDLTTVQYDLFVEIYGRTNSVTPNY